jgi:hypothetical protein
MKAYSLPSKPNYEIAVRLVPLQLIFPEKSKLLFNLFIKEAFADIKPVRIFNVNAVTNIKQSKFNSNGLKRQVVTVLA